MYVTVCLAGTGTLPNTDLNTQVCFLSDEVIKGVVPVLVQLPGAVTQNPGSPVLLHRPSHVGTAGSSRPAWAPGHACV